MIYPPVFPAEKFFLALSEKKFLPKILKPEGPWIIFPYIEHITVDRINIMYSKACGITGFFLQDISASAPKIVKSEYTDM